MPADMTMQIPRASITRRAFGFAIVLGIASLAPRPGNATELAATANVEILSLITITEDFNLDFGGIIPPSSGTQDFEVDTDGDMNPGPGDGQAVGGHSRGRYQITGTAAEPYTLTIAADGCSNANLQLLSVESDVGLPTILNEVDLHIGGKLRVGFLAPPGPHTCNYSLQAEY